LGGGHPRAPPGDATLAMGIPEKGPPPEGGGGE
jgi:hypothetical protein